MSERGMRKDVLKALRRINGIAVENPALPGTPDVNYVEGWIELKWIRTWPKGGDTVVRLDHYTRQQRVWAFRRRRAGGQAWLLLRCRTEWILLDGAVAALIINKATKAELIERAAAYWKTGLPTQELIDLLQQGQRPYLFTPYEIQHLRERT